MKFSVVTPSSKGMPILRQCVGSVRGQGVNSVKGYDLSVKQDGNLNPNTKNQTHRLAEPITVHQHIQDGGSSDGTVEFLKGLEANGSELKAKSLMPNVPPPGYSFSHASAPDNGMYDAINKGWTKADGDILSWLNADEQYLPGTLQKVADYFAAHPDVDAVFGNTIITTSTGEPYASRREISLRQRYVTNGFLYALSCSTFYRRKLWDSGLLKLDTQYRYSADLDLVLQLLSQGVRFGHINDFLALFGVEEGRNLSFRPEMKDETAYIQRKYGSFASPVARKAVMMCRYAERLLRGCYRAVPVNYAYALNEVPEYRICSNPALGFRFTYSSFKKGSRQDA